MKISELIHRLQQVQNLNGDLIVQVDSWDKDLNFSIEDVDQRDFYTNPREPGYCIIYVNARDVQDIIESIIEDVKEDVRRHI